MNKKLKIGIGVLVLVLGLSYLVFSGVRNFSSYSLTVSEVFAQSEGLYGERLRVSGEIIGESVDWNAEEISLNFKLKDEGGTDDIQVKYNGVKPDNFQDGITAIVEGEYTEAEYLRADKLMMQCPSRYEAELEDSSSEGHPEEVEIK